MPHLQILRSDIRQSDTWQISSIHQKVKHSFPFWLRRLRGEMSLKLIQFSDFYHLHLTNIKTVKLYTLNAIGLGKIDSAIFKNFSLCKYFSQQHWPWLRHYYQYMFSWKITSKVTLTWYILVLNVFLSNIYALFCLYKKLKWSNEYMHLKCKNSCKAAITNGVRQGWVVRPLLFLVHINVFYCIEIWITIYYFGIPTKHFVNQTFQSTCQKTSINKT